MELILQTLPAVADSEGSAAFFDYKDPLKIDACKLIQDGKSVDVLVDETAGSDVMAAWACRKIAHQSMNSDFPPYIAIGGVIDDAAKTKLRPRVAAVLNRMDPAARAAAVYAMGMLIPVTERIAFFKPLLKDPEPRVVAASVVQLWSFGINDKDIEVTVGDLLAGSNDPDLDEACCHWWAWSHPPGDEPIPPKLEMRFVALSTDSHISVRIAMIDAVAGYATADHPAMVSLLIKMARTDANASVRYCAVHGLRHAKTQAVYARLQEFLHDPQPMVREAAQEVLKEEKWDPAMLQAQPLAPASIPS
jgi:hypothetical protein